MLTSPPALSCRPCWPTSRAEPDQGPLPRPLKAWPLGSSQGTVSIRTPKEGSPPAPGRRSCPRCPPLGLWAQPHSCSRRGPRPRCLRALSSAPAWLVHSPPAGLTSRKPPGRHRSHVCTSPLPGGRQGTGCLHPACRAQREASPAPGARSPEGTQWGHMWGLLGTEHSVRVLPSPGVPGEAPSRDPHGLSELREVQEDEGQPGSERWEALPVEEGGESRAQLGGHSRGVEATLRGEGGAAARVCLGSEESSGPQGVARSCGGTDLRTGWTQLGQAGGTGLP